MQRKEDWMNSISWLSSLLVFWRSMRGWNKTAFHFLLGLMYWFAYDDCCGRIFAMKVAFHFLVWLTSWFACKDCCVSLRAGEALFLVCLQRLLTAVCCRWIALQITCSGEARFLICLQRLWWVHYAKKVVVHYLVKFISWFGWHDCACWGCIAKKVVIHVARGYDLTSISFVAYALLS